MRARSAPTVTPSAAPGTTRGAAVTRRPQPGSSNEVQAGRGYAPSRHFGEYAPSHSLMEATIERLLATNQGSDEGDEGSEHRPSETQPHLCPHARGARRPTFTAALNSTLSSNSFLVACPEPQGRA